MGRVIVCEQKEDGKRKKKRWKRKGLRGGIFLGMISYHIVDWQGLTGVSAGLSGFTLVWFGLLDCGDDGDSDAVHVRCWYGSAPRLLC